MEEECHHYRIKVDVRHGRCDVGWHLWAECADCGREFEIVEFNGEEIE